MIIKVNHRVKDTDIVCEQKWQAMPVLIHSAHRGKNPDVISPSALLVEGSAPKPLCPLNAEFHSAATRPMDAYDHDRLTAGRGLFLVLFSVPHPFSAADPHWPLPSKVPAFPHGNAGTRRRFSSFPPAVWHTQIAGL